MPTKIQIEIATVLNRDLRGENNLYVETFSPSNGIVRALKKISARKTSELPDFFDDISFDAESDSPDSVKFIRDFLTLKRRGDIAKSYEAFDHASAICSCVLKNGINSEDAARLHSRLVRALDSIAEAAPPEIIRLKFMYLLARDEGYPIIEDFYARLPDSKKNLMSILIKTPSSQASEFRSRCDDILTEMCEWIYANTDILPS